MSFAFRIIALLLLALWLPATQHCALIAASGGELDCCSSTCTADQRDMHMDACSVVESGDYGSDSRMARTPAPDLVFVACLACIHARLLVSLQDSPLPPFHKDDPTAWIPRWYFDARAALPARAPTLT